MCICMSTDKRILIVIMPITVHIHTMYVQYCSTCTLSTCSCRSIKSTTWYLSGLTTSYDSYNIHVASHQNRYVVTIAVVRILLYRYQPPVWRSSHYSVSSDVLHSNYNTLWHIHVHVYTWTPHVPRVIASAMCTICSLSTILMCRHDVNSTAELCTLTRIILAQQQLFSTSSSPERFGFSALIGSTVL